MSSQPEARDALAAIFEAGFERATEGRPYDYADEIIRRMEQSGWGWRRLPQASS